MIKGDPILLCSMPYPYPLFFAFWKRTSLSNKLSLLPVVFIAIREIPLYMFQALILHHIDY